MYETKGDSFLKQLALDTVEGKVFTDKHIPEKLQAELTPAVFLPFTVLNKDQLAELKSYKIQLIFEYLDKAKEEVNGLPVFMTMQVLNNLDADKFWDYFEQEKNKRS